MVDWASASMTCAAATARSRLPVWAWAISDASSSSWKPFHHSASGQTGAPSLTGPVKTPGNMSCGIDCGTGVEQPASKLASRGKARSAGVLFIAQRMYGGGARHPAGLGESRGPGDDHGGGACAHEIDRAECDAIGKALQPAVQIIPGH